MFCLFQQFVNILIDLNIIAQSQLQLHGVIFTWSWNCIRSIKSPAMNTQPSASAGRLLTRNPVAVEDTILERLWRTVRLTREDSLSGGLEAGE